MKAHLTYDEDGRLLAMIHPASDQSINTVLNATQDCPSHNGRSQWMWVRLANGDLILGIFPQGDTYLACEEDAQYTG